jgi:uncharacterized protein YciI
MRTLHRHDSYLGLLWMPPAGNVLSVHFAVIREQGPGWDFSRAMRDQAYWSEHATFINGVAEAGLLILGGPMSDVGPDGESAFDPTEPVRGRTYRALLILDVANERELARQLDDDPWTTHRVLETKAIYRWEVLVGELAPP